MVNDTDFQETEEWKNALRAVMSESGSDRARFLLDELHQLAQVHRLNWQPSAVTPYINTVRVEEQPPFPGDLDLEERLASLMRWNALAMVVRANSLSSELGGGTLQVMQVQLIYLRLDSITSGERVGKVT